MRKRAGNLGIRVVCCCGAGQEVTQYTYFQQAAGQALPVPSVEITYGLERILTALQVAPLPSAAYVTGCFPQHI